MNVGFRASSNSGGSQGIYYDRLGAFDEYAERVFEEAQHIAHTNSVSSIEDTCNSLNALSQLLEEEDAQFLKQRVQERTDHLSGKFISLS